MATGPCTNIIDHALARLHAKGWSIATRLTTAREASHAWCTATGARKIIHTEAPTQAEAWENAVAGAAARSRRPN